MSSTPIAQAYKFCPQCGSRNPCAGQIPFRCLDCDFAVFFGPVAATGGLIVNNDGELLLVRRAREPGKGKWGLPGGFVDADETVEEAVRREIEEETGLQVESLTYLMSHPNGYVYQGFMAPVIDLFYMCRVRRSQKIDLDLEELEHFEWCRPTAAHLENMAFESNRLAVEHWLSRHPF